MKILFRLSALAALCICASAATHIQSNEYYADGVTPFAGKLYVMGPSGSTTTASTVLPSVTIGAVGLVDVSLIGCAGCTYRVTFQLVNARGTVTQTWQETWVVPDTSATLTRATVVDGANSPSGIINPQRMGSVGLTAGQIWVWDGAKWIAAANAAGGGGGGGGGTWGTITGTIANQIDLANSLAGKASLAHVHIIADITGLQSALNAEEATANKGQVSGYASLDATGKVPSAQLPSSSGMTSLSQDTAPQLGGALDMNGWAIQAVTPVEMARVHGVTSGVQSQIDGKSAVGHLHTGVYEPVDVTILRQANLAGSGSAVTPAHSDHTHSGYQATISGAPGTWPTSFPPVNSGNWAGMWQTYAPSYFQPALTAYSAISGLSGYPSTFPPPSPGASTKGGVQSHDCTGTGHLLSINTDGTTTCSADGGGGGSGIAPYVSALITDTSMTHTIAGTTHGFITAGCPLVVSVWDNSTPQVEQAVGVSKAPSSCDVTITFASTPDNYYVVINGGVGPQGAAGAQGVAGSTGSTGSQGIQGIQGIQGAAGATGAAGQGVPAGGTTGQVLSKINGADYNTQWANQSGGSATNGTSGQGLTSNGSGGFGTPVTLGTAAAHASTDFQPPITTGTTAQYFRGDLSLATFPTTWAWGSLTGVPSTFAPPSPGAATKGGVLSKDCTGTGHILSINTDGTTTCSADHDYGAGIVTMVTGAGAPSAACVAPSLSNLQTYTDTTNQDLWACVATNTWKKLLSTTNSGATWEFFAQGTCPAAADVTTAGYDYALCMQYGALNQRASTALGGALTAIGSGGGGAASWTTLTDLQWTTLTN
jgi:hypothetical protein